MFFLMFINKRSEINSSSTVKIAFNNHINNALKIIFVSQSLTIIVKLRLDHRFNHGTCNQMVTQKLVRTQGTIIDI